MRASNCVRRDQLEAVLEALPDGPYQHVDYALFLAAGFTGLRLGELLELTWSRLDWIDQRVVAPGRLVPMHDRVGQAFERLSDESEEPDQLVFREPLTGAARLRAACARVGVPPARSFDDLRTGFAVACAQGGVPLDELARWLGVRLAALEWLAAFTPQRDPAWQIMVAFGGFE